LSENPILKKRVYGRKHGRPMHKGRTDVIETVLPILQIPKEKLKEDGSLNPKDVFGCEINKLHFEIGFGNGEHLLYIMNEYPTHHFIGAEPYMNGMSAFLKSLPTPTPNHVRVHMDDALMVLNSLPDASVDFLYILNPDPWPKTRHHKRRIVSEENLEIYARVLKDGATMIQTTDVDELAEWMLTKTINCPHFNWLAECPEDWKTAPNGWMSTRYEEKGRLAGRSQTYLIYHREIRHKN
jgi:tRNA (guanine-N7-)-methyltransferase